MIDDSTIIDYSNSRAFKRKKEIQEVVSLKNDNDILTKRCKFNFHYFDKDNAGQDFKDWSQPELVDLFNKIKEYSENSLEYWKRQSTSGSGNVLEIYEDFPIRARTDFTQPKYIPHEAHWGRFRIKAKVRLVGFVIPHSFHNNEHTKTGMRWDKNTFYVVFLDKDHKFYKTEPK